MNLNYLLNRTSTAAAAIVLISIPCQATIISAAAEGSPDMAVSCAADGETGMVPGASVMSLPGFNSSSLSTFELAVDANATGVSFGNDPGCGKLAALLTPMPDFTNATKRTPRQVDSAGGNVVGDIPDEISFMAPGAGGSAVNAAPSSKRLHIDVEAGEPTPSDRSGQVPEPIFVVILAFGLLGISAGIRKYFS